MIDRFVLAIRRGDTPLFRMLRRLRNALLRSNFFAPRALYPLYRGMYFLHFAILYASRWTLNYFYREPLFRSRCASCGKRLSLWLAPHIVGRPEIHIGNDVNLFGRIDIITDPAIGGARFAVQDRVDVGHNVRFIVNLRIEIEEEVNIASGCTFMDSDSGSPGKRPPDSGDSLPVRICRGAWIGQNAFILKGVTVGEGAVVGVNSVVVSDIPPFSVALGNPARVVFKNPPRAPQKSEPASAR
jgi:acetyltransferase-like isoleucine patch superfamily enzyme